MPLIGTTCKSPIPYQSQQHSLGAKAHLCVYFEVAPPSSSRINVWPLRPRCCLTFFSCSWEMRFLNFLQTPSYMCYTSPMCYMGSDTGFAYLNKAKPFRYLTCPTSIVATTPVSLRCLEGLVSETETMVLLPSNSRHPGVSHSPCHNNLGGNGSPEKATSTNASEWALLLPYFHLSIR
jgi:hypothetical protein